MAESQPGLFAKDNMPKWTPGTPATKFYRDAKGNPQVLDVVLNYSQPMHPFDAISDFQAGNTVFVAREHAAAVAKELGVPYAG